MLSKSFTNFGVAPQKLAANTKQTRVQGSMKNGVTATELLEERAKCDFDQNDLANGLFGEELLRITYDT